MAASRPSSLEDFPTRPTGGTMGRKIQVTTNYWAAKALPKGDLYQYDVDITDDKSKPLPIPVNRKVFNAVVRAASNENETFQGKAGFTVYDGRKIAYSPVKINMSSADAYRLAIELPEDDGNGNGSGNGHAQSSDSRARPPRKFNFVIKFACSIKMDRLEKFLKGALDMGDQCQDVINLFDIAIRHNASLISGAETVGRGWYLRSLFTASGDLGNGAEAWNGVKMSMRAGSGQMFLNADLATTAFLISGPAIDVAKRILGASAIQRELGAHQVQTLQRLLGKVRITLAFRSNGRKKYNINKIGDTPASRLMFEHATNGVTRKISVADYFREQYNITLQYPHLPCFSVGDLKRPVQLPFEVVEIPPGQCFKRKLDEGQTGKMIVIAQQKPNERLNRAGAGVKALVADAAEGQDFRTNDYLDAFGIRIAKDPVALPARILEAPLLCYNPKSKEKEFKPRDGAWNMKDHKVARGMTLHSWSVLVLVPENRLKRDVVDNFTKVLVQTARIHGMEVPMERPPLRYGSDRNMEDMLKAAYRDAGEGCSKKPQMILVILPDTNPRRYAEIKRTSDTILGVVTQCMQSKHAFKAAPQYCANLVLKINVKLGGFNSFLAGKTATQGPQLPFISEAPTLVIGADVTHPGPGEGNSRPSIAALVGSLDAQCARFAATLRIQRSPQGRQRSDIIQDMKGMVTELLRGFFRETKVKPARIVVYRDGASEGQFKEIRHTEIKAIRNACDDIEKASGSGKAYSPPITYIVVTKRHNTRFFPRKKDEADRSGNCQPGTVVDTVITHPKEWDFFLNSHAGLLGTSRSAHYHVLHDDNKFTSDKLQNMTYRLCYLYARCTRSVSICPPIYYADLVAARARAHFQGMEWGDDETSSSGGQGSEKAKLWDERYAKVKPELALVMYYM
ncbi:hypothetical protein HKX48_009212 [Thoreauomyces humboldtii]|nr:hypothetical protein HKX48_009212 [Thoreauomyces humboldtii]